VFSGSELNAAMTAEEALARLTDPEPPAEVVEAAKAIFPKRPDLAANYAAHVDHFLNQITGGVK
jgi:hypothetical protein